MLQLIHCRLLEVSSNAGTHLKANASQSSKANTENGRHGKASRSGLSKLSSLSQRHLGGNLAYLQSPSRGTDEFWMHPAVGDCVIHLGAVPLAGHDLVTR